MANAEQPERLAEVDIPKLPLYLAFGVIFGVAPMLPNRYNRDLVYLVSTIYKRVGPLGLLGIPFCTLAMEKTAHDTVHGIPRSVNLRRRREKERAAAPVSLGGAQLPSFSSSRRGSLVADPCVPAALDPANGAATARDGTEAAWLALNPEREQDPRASTSSRQVRVHGPSS